MRVVYSHHDMRLFKERLAMRSAQALGAGKVAIDWPPWGRCERYGVPSAANALVGGARLSCHTPPIGVKWLWACFPENWPPPGHLIQTAWPNWAVCPARNRSTTYSSPPRLGRICPRPLRDPRATRVRPACVAPASHSYHMHNTCDLREPVSHGARSIPLETTVITHSLPGIVQRRITQQVVRCTYRP